MPAPARSDRARLLVLADPLLSAGLKRLLEVEAAGYQILTAAVPGSEANGGNAQSITPGFNSSSQESSGQDAGSSGLPQLVIWHSPEGIDAGALGRECRLLLERWQPAPLLLLLPDSHRLRREELLALPATGVLQAPDADALSQAVATLLGGGRVLQWQAAPARPTQASSPDPGGTRLGLGSWLLLSGLQQIDGEIGLCHQLLTSPRCGRLGRWLVAGRLRELGAARQLLLWLWGPVSLAWHEQPAPMAPPPASEQQSLSLSQRSSEAIWTLIHSRLRQAASSQLANGSGQLLAMEGLNDQRRSDLLLALLDQLALLRGRLADEDLAPEQLTQRWHTLQGQLRQQALRTMASPYVQLPYSGVLQPVAEALIRSSDLEGEGSELPDPEPMLGSLVLGHPLLVEGQLLPPDEPRALLYLEQLVANWMVRNAERICQELLACCGSWPELRRYLLQPALLPTRNLERLRNQLLAQQRWSSWFELPIALYESRRQLLCLEAGQIRCRDLTEPRDEELKRLNWFQQSVTLALETRDALAPQVRRLVRSLGRLLVVLLSQVVGRAIGLVGRGILQGMGRSLGPG